MNEIKKIKKIILFLILLVAICSIAFCSLEGNTTEGNTTTITIKNNTNKCIENLIVSSNYSEEYKIESIEPYATFDLMYNIGKFNENALNMRHVVNKDRVENYNILGYIDKPYKCVSIYIDSIDEYCNLDIRVETP